MVWKKEIHPDKEKIEKVVKSGFSGKFDKTTNFPIEEESCRDFGQFDLQDHQLTEKEKRDAKEMRELERRGLL